MKISYAITVCDELEEFDRLLSQLVPHLDEHEIVVLVDTTKGKQDDLFDIYIKHIQSSKSNQFSFYHTKLNNNFANFKNTLIEYCSGDYILQLDADELLSDNLLKHLILILESNDDIDCFNVPRENRVEGLTQAHIDKWRWYVDQEGRINYPDFQMRLFRNSPLIRYVNKVHEKLVGMKRMSELPSSFYLIHNKSIDKQEKQNQFYEQL